MHGAQGDHPTKGREAPEAEAVQPSRIAGGGKANGIVLWRELEGNRGLVGYGRPSGVVRGECRGGLGGAAAPNRPPSAARREGGQNSAKKEAAAKAAKIKDRD